MKVFVQQDGGDFTVLVNGDEPGRDVNDHCALRKLGSERFPLFAIDDYDLPGAEAARAWFRDKCNAIGVVPIFD